MTTLLVLRVQGTFGPGSPGRLQPLAAARGAIPISPCRARPVAHALCNAQLATVIPSNRWARSTGCCNTTTLCTGIACCRTAPRIGSHSSRPHWGEMAAQQRHRMAQVSVELGQGASAAGSVVAQLCGGHHHGGFRAA